MKKSQMDDLRWERSGVKLSRHFALATRRLREKALHRDDYDPARLFKWGQMMALAVVRMMEGVEKRFYKPFDCRVQRYIVQGLLEAFQESTEIAADARFTQIMPKGAETCRFEIRLPSPAMKEREWTQYSAELAQRALERISHPFATDPENKKSVAKKC